MKLYHFPKKRLIMFRKHTKHAQFRFGVHFLLKCCGRLLCELCYDLLWCHWENLHRVHGCHQGQIQNWSSLRRTELLFSTVLSFQSEAYTHFMYITWINNQCTLWKHQWGTAMIKHITIATHLKVQRTEFCSKILSVTKIHFRLSCFSSCVILYREFTTQ